MSLKISVYITSYNQKSYLVEAIESVLNQTVLPHQIIIIDDYSNDGSQDVIAGYASRYPGLITPIYHSRNLGITQTRLDALVAVTGDYVTPLDGDDRFLATKLEKEAAFLRENPGAQIAFSNYYYISANGRRTGIWADGEKPSEGYIFCQVFARDFPRGDLFRNELVNYQAWKEIGFHDPQIRLYADFDMRIRLTKVCRVVYTAEPLSEYRMGVNGLSSAKATTHLANLEYILEKNKHLLKDVTQEQRDYVWRNINEFFGRVAGQAMRQILAERDHINNGFNALRYYLKSAKYKNEPIDYRFALRLLLPGRAYTTLEFIGWDEDSGLGPEEGPYPEWNLPVVRWGLGPRTELRFNSDGTPLILSMVCGPHHLSRQNMRIFLNGGKIQQERFDSPGEFRDIRIPIKPCTSHNIVTFEYQTWDKTDPGLPMAMLFKKLRIAPS